MQVAEDAGHFVYRPPVDGGEEEPMSPASRDVPASTPASTDIPASSHSPKTSQVWGYFIFWLIVGKCNNFEKFQICLADLKLKYIS